MAFFVVCTSADAAANFSGSWTGWSCPGRIAYDAARCSSFSLRLYQKNNHVCGTHLFATAGARQMDEGGTPSLSGKIDNAAAKARVTVESGRVSPPIHIPVTLAVNRKDSLTWERLESPVGDYLLPSTMQLVRAKQESLLKPVFEQRLAAACDALLNTQMSMPESQPAARPAVQPEARPDAGQNNVQKSAPATGR